MLPLKLEFEDKTADEDDEQELRKTDDEIEDDEDELDMELGGDICLGLGFLLGLRPCEGANVTVRFRGFGISALLIDSNSSVSSSHSSS